MDSDSTDLVINQCPECSQDLDVTGLSPFSKIACPYCQSSVRVRTRLGQYQITRLLGEGGMSQVFAADDATLGRQVALKILHQSLSQDKKLTDMFEREAKLTASINHPNVVKVYTVGEEKGYFYIAMELVDATSIEQMIAEHGALPEQTVLSIAADVVAGLKAAYANNLIHRDIKPGNMLMTKDGTTKLVDFGLAVAQGGADENEDLWATPFYVPPEKLVREPDTYLGDIYALGATCYHALAGKPAFLANTNSLEELIEIKAQGVDLKAAAPDASKATVKLFEKMMAHSASSRPASYDKLLSLVAECRGENAASAASSHTPARRKRKSLIPLAIVAAAVIGAVAWFATQGEGDNGNNEFNSLLGGQNDRVISAEEKEAARQLLAGRTAMVRGRLGEARQTFEKLEGNASFKQPVKAWNTFNLGLTDLLIGEEKRARAAFTKLGDQKGFDDKALKPYSKFFGNMGDLLADPLPTVRSEITSNKDNFQSIGLLAAGLKNWQMGHFAEADKFFQDFAQIETPVSDPWIGELKSVLGNYRADYQAYQKAPNPSRNMGEGELRKTIDQLKEQRKQAKTKGAYPKLLGSRISRGEQFLKQRSAPKPPPATNSTEWTDAEKADLQSLQGLISSSLQGHRDTYLFSAAVVKVKETALNSPKGKLLKSDVEAGYAAADQFLGQLAQLLNDGQYKGSILRKEGLPLDARVAAATEELITVDLGFGPNPVEVEKFEPRWMVEAAVALLGEPSKDKLQAWRSAYWFATVMGLKEHSNALGRRLVSIDPKFAEDSKRFTKLTF